MPIKASIASSHCYPPRGPLNPSWRLGRSSRLFWHTAVLAVPQPAADERVITPSLPRLLATSAMVQCKEGERTRRGLKLYTVEYYPDAVKDVKAVLVFHHGLVSGSADPRPCTVPVAAAYQLNRPPTWPCRGSTLGATRRVSAVASAGRRAAAAARPAVAATAKRAGASLQHAGAAAATEGPGISAVRRVAAVQCSPSWRGRALRSTLATPLGTASPRGPVH